MTDRISSSNTKALVLHVAFFSRSPFLFACHAVYQPRPIPEADLQPRTAVESLAQSVTETSLYSLCDLRGGTWAVDDSLTVTVQPDAQLVISLVIRKKRLYTSSLRFTKPLTLAYDNIDLLLNRISVNENGHISLDDLRLKNLVAQALLWPAIDNVKARFLSRIQAETNAFALLQGRFLVSRANDRQPALQNVASIGVDRSLANISPSSTSVSSTSTALPPLDFRMIIERCAMELSDTRLMTGSTLLLRKEPGYTRE